MNKKGRPSLYTETIADSICEHIAGGRSLVSWCKDNGINYVTVTRWLLAHEGFRNNYTRAREAQADYLAEEIVQISDDGANDSYTDDEGNVRTDHDVIARSRLRVDARKWYASKLAPKKYSDKLELGGELTVKTLSQELIGLNAAVSCNKTGREVPENTG